MLHADVGPAGITTVELDRDRVTETALGAELAQPTRKSFSPGDNARPTALPVLMMIVDATLGATQALASSSNKFSGKLTGLRQRA